MAQQQHTRLKQFDNPAAERYAARVLNIQTPAFNQRLAVAKVNCRANDFPKWMATPSQGKFIMLQPGSYKLRVP
jgi:hypothetical protein